MSHSIPILIIQINTNSNLKWVIPSLFWSFKSIPNQIEESHSILIWTFAPKISIPQAPFKTSISFLFLWKFKSLRCCNYTEFQRCFTTATVCPKTAAIKMRSCMMSCSRQFCSAPGVIVALVILPAGFSPKKLVSTTFLNKCMRHLCEVNCKMMTGH